MSGSGTITVTIDGKQVQARAGETVLQAARRAGISIPVLCEHPALPPSGSCRICLVEIERQQALQTACTLPVSDGMVIHTQSPRVREARAFMLELLIANHPLDCMTCDAAGECLLQDLAYEYGVKGDRLHSNSLRYPVDTSNPFIVVDRNKCILCGRCVRACQYVNGVEAIHVFQRGAESYIGFGLDGPMQESACEFCGSCVAVCPTAALWPKMSIGKARPWQVRKVDTICSYCGVGCKITLHVKDNRIVRVDGAWDGPANHGWTCVKGRFGYDYVHHPDRLTRPRVRRYLLQGQRKNREGAAWEWVDTDWETALQIVARRLSEVWVLHGPQSIGILASAKCLNEENYLMNKLARQVIGTNNIDHCARLCHSSTVAGLAISFGSGAMSNSIDDVAEQAQAYFVIGSNTTEQHPVIGMRLRQAVRQRGAHLIVADPRRIDLCDFATLHLQHRPGTDNALINGLMYIILEKGWEDKEFIASGTEGFEEFKATVMDYPPERVSAITGVPIEYLYRAAEIMATSKPMAVLWAMGITQHVTGVQNVMNLANLQMLLGNMGKPGGGVNPLRGQNNVQGACDMGGLPNVYPAYQPVTSEEARRKFAQAWGLDEAPLSPEAPRGLSASIGMTVTEMIPAILQGRIHALYILGENPVMSDADTHHVRQCLEQVDFLVLQEIFPSETSVYADVLLPGVTFAEKSGTFTNTERRVQPVHKAIDPPGEARPDWWIIAEIARRLIPLLAQQGRTIDLQAPWARWDYADTSAILAEINALAPSYAGITWERLEKGETLQWPCPAPTHPGTPILHVERFTRGLGRFVAVDYLPPAEWPDDQYPMILSTGRVLYHWHGGEMTRRSRGLLEIYPEPRIEISQEDAERLGLNGSPRVRVISRRGSIEAEAQITDRVPAGMVFASFHFPQASANVLTNGAALDPVSRIPQFKVSAVRVEKVENNST